MITAMKIRTIARLTREGCKNVFRNGWMTFAAVSAVTVTLLILGLSMILSLNVQHISSSIESQLQINAYVADSYPAKALPALGAKLKALPGVRSVKFVSKQQALQEMKGLLKKNQSLIAGLGNPLPNEYVLQADNPRATPLLAKQVAALAGIAKVQYGQSFIGRLFTVTSIVRDTALVFIVALLAMGIFLISNTIKITIFTRRREIEIMKLVGATNGFIRGPFFIEGTMIGLVGALIPSIVLLEGYRWLVANVVLFPPFTLLAPQDVFEQVVAVLLLCGFFMGLWGSLVSVRRFLRK